MGGGSANKTAKQGNAIAQASLNESRRQYEEQQAKERAKKEAAMSNAAGSRQSANMAYSNNFSPSSDLTSGRTDSSGVLTAGGTQSIVGSLLGGLYTDQKTTLGG